mgnify:FL=1
MLLFGGQIFLHKFPDGVQTTRNLRSGQQVSLAAFHLIQAVRTTYRNYDALLDDLLVQLDVNDRAAAADIYYNRLFDCGKYLQQYTSQLLQTAISEGQSTYSSLSALNARLKGIEIGRAHV